jgi:UDP-sulfoquinovose synthase
MRVLILGCDGYLGFSLIQYLKARGCEVIGIDNLSRRKLVRGVGGASLTPDLPLFEKVELLDAFYYGDLEEHIRPALAAHGEGLDAIVHLAEQPSAPYSMIGPKEAKATIRNNVEGTMDLLFAMRDFAPDVHLVKLGTMGEYGTPGIRITEGKMQITRGGKTAELPFPKQPGSIYHASKVMDTSLIEMLCRIWHLRSTDIMQGVVYGVAIEENIDKPKYWTRFDYDGVFGTCINRYITQALYGYPLTVYGEGGQTRGFLDIRDSMDCLWLAIQNPPHKGEYRVFNQLANVYSVKDLALRVADIVYEEFDIPVKIQKIENPRVEAEEHFYEVQTDALRRLGYKPRDLDDGLRLLVRCLSKYKEQIDGDKILPGVYWRGNDEEDEPVEMVAEKTA